MANEHDGTWGGLLRWIGEADRYFCAIDVMRGDVKDCEEVEE